MKVGLSLVLHLTQVRQANFMSMLDKMLQNNGIFWESMTFQHFVDMSTSCTTKFAGLVLFDVAFLPYMLSSCWWHINDKPKCCKIPLTWVICCNVNSLKIFVSRGYQTMTKKIGIFKNFYCIFGIFGAREVHHTKRKKNMLGSTFFALKFGTFQAFFNMSLTCCMSCVVSAGYPGGQWISENI